MQRDMFVINLLGKRINTIKIKLFLRNAFFRVYVEFNHVFKEIFNEKRTKCLIMFAQRCNYNYKKNGIELEIIKNLNIRRIS